MWRRTYFLLIFLRLYFALCSSYLHPDEHFQGPEAISEHIFSYKVSKTWEFTSDRPIRSAFAIWPVYGLPMLVLKELWEGLGYGVVKPSVVFWTLRILMFLLSFALEDWAIHELVDSPRRRRVAILLVASSYVSWTWQLHTFSNSIETLVVAWSLVLIKRVVEDKRWHKSGLIAPALLAVLLVYGTFNRITFPAFVVFPLLQLIPLFRRRPEVFAILVVVGLFTSFVAIAVDTTFYSDQRPLLSDFFLRPVITPLNGLLYNIQPENLAIHGTHPFYQHFLINLPQLLGPAFILLLTTPLNSSLLWTALTGISVLSCFSHQEARFLLPAVPLILSSVRLPVNAKHARVFAVIWIVSNLVLGALMGIYHQGGVVPAQIFLESQTDMSSVYWWKTYSPPTWLLNGRTENITTVDLMGHPQATLAETICTSPSKGSSSSGKALVAPRSATFLDQFVGQYAGENEKAQMMLWETWTYSRHINLDDLDFGDDGVWSTLKRVLGRKGLAIWRVSCRDGSRSRW